MCQYCLQHGEGKKWYLEAKNYSDDLLSDVKRYRFMEKFFTDLDALRRNVEALKLYDKAPLFVKQAVRWGAVAHYKKWHYGQVVPIEDVERIFEFVNSVTRIACVCRHLTHGKEQRYCYAVSLGPNGGKMSELLLGLDPSYVGGPEAKGMERIDKEEALESLRKFESHGLCHTVWTFKTPYIGGFCNCDRADCMAMRTTVTHGIPLMFRAEYVAAVDEDQCKGCRECMKVCQFGAIGYSAAAKKTWIDPRRCYGCGICRAVCEKGAVQLKDRAEVPLAANTW